MTRRSLVFGKNLLLWLDSSRVKMNDGIRVTSTGRPTGHRLVVTYSDGQRQQSKLGLCLYFTARHTCVTLPPITVFLLRYDLRQPWVPFVLQDATAINCSKMQYIDICHGAD